MLIRENPGSMQAESSKQKRILPYLYFQPSALSFQPKIIWAAHLIHETVRKNPQINITAKSFGCLTLITNCTKKTALGFVFC
jgi:hypothetical protein